MIAALITAVPCLAAPALSFTPGSSTYNASPGSVVDLSAVLQNIGDAPLYVNGISIIFNGPAGSYFSSNPFFSFFDNIPGVFTTTDPAFTGNLAELIVNPAVPSGTYTVSVELIGGGSPLLTDAAGNGVGTQTFTIVVGPSSSGGPPAITTSSPLPPGSVGVAYSESLSATGGTGSYSNWMVTAGSLPAGLSLSPASGVISGIPLTISGAFNFMVSVRDTAGNTGSATLQLAIQPAASAASPAPIGGFAQIASGAGWQTTMTLINLSAATVNGQVTFYGAAGSAMTLPLMFPQFGLSLSASSQTFTLSPGASLVIQSGGGSALSVGWANVQATGALTGYSIFDFNLPGGDSEGTVPFDNSISSTLLLPYDNTNGYRTGVALANETQSSASITASVLDQNGVRLASSQISLPAFAHMSLFVDQLFSVSANGLGVVQFQSTEAITAIGLRFSPSGSFTSIPTVR
jgi:hypothetical protein